MKIKIIEKFRNQNNFNPFAAVFLNDIAIYKLKVIQTNKTKTKYLLFDRNK